MSAYSPAAGANNDRANEVLTVFLSVIGSIVLAALVTRLLHGYANWRKTEWYTLAAVWINWFLAVSILVLIPIDVSSSSHDDCRTAQIEAANMTAYNETVLDVECLEPWVHFSEHEMDVLWRILYWISFVMGWVIVPVMQSYVLTGHFHWHQRFARAIWENLAIYGAGAFIGIVFVIWLIAKKGYSLTSSNKGESLEDLAMLASNLYGLVITLLLLGYGLVEWPRKLWRKSFRGNAMDEYKWQAFHLLEDYQECKNELDAVMKLVKNYDDKVPKDNRHRKYLEVVISKLPAEYSEVNSGSGEVRNEYSDYVSLHNRVKNAVREITNARALYTDLLRRAWNLEDVEKSKDSPTHEIEWTFKKRRETNVGHAISVVEWFWRCHAQVTILRILVVFFGIFSCAVVWSEFTWSFGLSKGYHLSIFYWFTTNKQLPYPVQMFLVMIPLSYIAFCAYWSMFRLRIFKFYRLVPHHNSDSNSLLFNAYYLARIIAPLAYNYLEIINADDAEFSKIMGDDPLLNGLWKRIMPLVLIVLCLGNLFNLYSKLGEFLASAISCCYKIRITRFDHEESFTDERVEKGKMIIASERDYKRLRQILSIDVGINLLKLKKNPLQEETTTGSSWKDRIGVSKITSMLPSPTFTTTTTAGSSWRDRLGLRQQQRENLNSLELTTVGHVPLEDV